ncbi:chemotaxis protein CheY [Lysobacter concretionis Ko07 = DSM 16239]|jgi:two-component system response regulator AlgR|uniref:Chemotaxis protein CheY n=1 Tax=Lysobacter concretionis Ko07 = DSM 16239 TaxID=1122185 RepID=A0A0A0EPB5_9GAMM|nr:MULTISPECIES: LytTR family DNA-binding domain-containing protein [Lysobacter]KGM52816.1 chemotaxis protein CheY [Lysobacter concretionis Ko07 = DSM 16239]QOD91259.1 response regulator transcription factor [Lysobacter sp. CW239]
MRVVIADDEPLALARLRGLLKDLPGIEVVAEAGDGQQALQACAEHEPDLVLLDIAMPGIDGLEAARHLAAFEPRPAVVFCTAYDAHALSAFEAEAIDYLVKPVRAERLAAALERVRTFAAGRERNAGSATDRKTGPRSHLCARLRGSLRLIPVEDVRYLYADEKYVVVHHARGEDLIEESLKSLEDEFGERFLRIHRNCLVARHEITELRRSPDGQVTVVLRHVVQPLEVSRRCVAGVREVLRHL